MKIISSEFFFFSFQKKKKDSTIPIHGNKLINIQLYFTGEVDRASRSVHSKGFLFFYTQCLQHAHFTLMCNVVLINSVYAGKIVTLEVLGMGSWQFYSGNERKRKKSYGNSFVSLSNRRKMKRMKLKFVGSATTNVLPAGCLVGLRGVKTYLCMLLSKWV